MLLTCQQSAHEFAGRQEFQYDANNNYTKTETMSCEFLTRRNDFFVVLHDLCANFCGKMSTIETLYHLEDAACE